MVVNGLGVLGTSKAVIYCIQGSRQFGAYTAKKFARQPDLPFAVSLADDDETSTVVRYRALTTIFAKTSL